MQGINRSEIALQTRSEIFRLADVKDTSIFIKKAVDAWAGWNL
jgi:hypothetical protein